MQHHTNVFHCHPVQTWTALPRTYPLPPRSTKDLPTQTSAPAELQHVRTGRSSKHTKTSSAVAAPHRGHLDLFASHNLPGNKSQNAEPTSIHPKFGFATRMPTKARTTWQDAASNNPAQHVRAVGALLPEVPVESCHHTCRRVIPQPTASVERSLCHKVQRLTHVFPHLSLLPSPTHCVHQEQPFASSLSSREHFVSRPTTQRNPIHGVTPRRSSKREHLHA